jgi:hypothetical protein
LWQAIIKRIRQLKIHHRLGHVLHVGRRGKTVRHELSPFQKVRLPAEIFRVVLDCRPFDEQPITGEDSDKETSRLISEKFLDVCGRSRPRQIVADLPNVCVFTGQVGCYRNSRKKNALVLTPAARR